MLQHALQGARGLRLALHTHGLVDGAQGGGGQQRRAGVEAALVAMVAADAIDGGEVVADRLMRVGLRIAFQERDSGVALAAVACIGTGQVVEAFAGVGVQVEEPLGLLLQCLDQLQQ